MDARDVYERAEGPRGAEEWLLNSIAPYQLSAVLIAMIGCHLWLTAEPQPWDG